MNIHQQAGEMIARNPHLLEPAIPTSPARPPDDLLRRLEARCRRKCADCGQDYEAVGLQGYCDTCSIKIDDAAALPPPRKMDSSWPRLHAEKVLHLTGKGREMAEKLAPRIFGNRLCVLAGDRGRGKTQIATYFAYHRMMKGHDSGVYARAYDAVNSIVGLDREKRLSAFQRVPFLCLDEAHRVEARRLPELESIVDARYANKRPTIIIGNWMTPEGVEHGECVSGQQLHGLGPTLMDRINEHTANRTGGVVWCRWESYRKAPTPDAEEGPGG